MKLNITPHEASLLAILAMEARDGRAYDLDIKASIYEDPEIGSVARRIALAMFFSGIPLNVTETKALAELQYWAANIGKH